MMRFSLRACWQRAAATAPERCERGDSCINPIHHMTRMPLPTKHTTALGSGICDWNDTTSSLAVTRREPGLNLA